MKGVEEAGSRLCKTKKKKKMQEFINDHQFHNQYKRKSDQCSSVIRIQTGENSLNPAWADTIFCCIFM